MAQYSFLTTWCVGAPLQRVWDVLSDPGGYPEWWKGVRKATVLEPGENGGLGVGTLYRLEMRSKLPYSLSFDSRLTRLEAPHLLEGQASGELEGVGAWRLYEGAAGTAAIYSWDVRTTRGWMNAIGPLARPAFAWNHNYVMRQGADDLAKKLGAELVAAS
ncbi:MAG: SRPBCC family protein [Solirubrobacterales bacterium]|nr:SRPBCC family protein [Solirubrobacterales bacterium]